MTIATAFNSRKAEKAAQAAKEEKDEAGLFQKEQNKTVQIRKLFKKQRTETQKFRH